MGQAEAEVKIGFTADFHIHPYRLCSRDGGHDRLLDGLLCLRQSLDLARSARAAWVNCGDFKMPKTSWPQEALTGSHEILRKYPDVDKLFVAGNHDATGLGGSGLAPFRDCAQVVESAAEYVRVKDSSGLAVTLLCVPWDAALDSLSPRGDVPVVAHGFLAGSMLGPEDLRIAKGTSVEAYGSFPFAVFGDVHKGQWRRPPDPALGSPATWFPYFSKPPVRKPGAWSGEVFYTGSPYQQSWGERNDPPKGGLLVDTDTGAVSLEPFLSPRFVHLEISTVADLELFLKNRGDYSGDFVRVVYSGPGSSVVGAAEHLGDSFRSYQFIVRRPPAQRSDSRADVHAGMGMDEILAGYVAANPLPDADPAVVLEAGRRLVR